MIDIVMLFIGPFANIVASLYVCGTVLSLKQQLCKRKNVFIILGISVLLEIVYLLTDNFIKVILNFIILSLTCKIVFKTDVIKSYILSFIALMVSLLGEVMCAILLVGLLNIDIYQMRNLFFGSLMTNVIIAIFIVVITNIPIIKKFLIRIVSVEIKQSKRKTYYMIVTTLVTLSMLVYYLFFDIDGLMGLFLSIVIIAIYFVLVFNIFNEKFNYEKLQTEMKVTEESLSEYEKLYSYQRMLNHEFKNDLMVIRGLTNKGNKRLLSYIDEITKFQNNKEEIWMNTLKRIPEGGLLGILYYKLLSMDQQNINVNFEIARNFKSKDYSHVDDNIKSKICKLLGIYLDNAIQAVIDLAEKNISIKIDQSNEHIIFNISNNFSGIIELSRIYEKGYTTNGAGRGYGLAIAQEILSNEEKMVNNTKIINNIFVQELKIKI